MPFKMLVFSNIYPKLTFIQSMFSSIDMTQLTPEKKTVFKPLIGRILYFFLGYRMRIKVISGLVKPGV